jgi:hypothetical protein
MAATTERMKAADTWRTEAGLQLLQLARLHALQVPAGLAPVHKDFAATQDEAEGSAELQEPACTTFWPLTVPEQE